MKTKQIIITVILLLCALPAFAQDWQENPVFLRDFDRPTVVTSYDATFGSGDYTLSGAINGNIVPFLSRQFYIHADRDLYGHDATIGYVGRLSPSSALGFFVTDRYTYATSDGTRSLSFNTPFTFIRVDAFTRAERENTVGFDAVFSHEVSGTFAWGAAFRYAYSDLLEEDSYQNIFTITPAPIPDTMSMRFSDTRSKNYLGGSVGIAVTPAEGLQLDLALAAGGFFGKRLRTEYARNEFLLAGGGLERYGYRADGDWRGFDLRARLGGSYAISERLSLPFSVGYSYKNETEQYDGYAALVSAGVALYRDYDAATTGNAVNAEIGLDYYPTGDPEGISVAFLSRYEFSRERGVVSATMVPLPPAAGAVTRDGEALTDSHMIGFTTTVSVPLASGLTLLGGIDYAYAFIRMNDSQIGVLGPLGTIDIYDNSYDGHAQYLDLILGLAYERGNLTVGLTSRIPIFTEADYTLPGSTYSFPVGVFLDNNPVSYTSNMKAYEVILELSYRF